MFYLQFYTYEFQGLRLNFAIIAFSDIILYFCEISGLVVIQFVSLTEKDMSIGLRTHGEKITAFRMNHLPQTHEMS